MHKFNFWLLRAFYLLLNDYAEQQCLLVNIRAGYVDPAEQVEMLASENTRPRGELDAVRDGVPV